jgi:TM2 domain-containing membrane protein YozV
MSRAKKTGRGAGAPVPEPPTVDRRLWLALALAVLWPGAGHLYLRRRGRGVVFCLLVLGMMALGLVLGGKLFTPVDEGWLARAATVASAGLGALYPVLLFVVDYQGRLSGAGYEYGTAYLLTAGLMNLLLWLDVWDLGRGVKE